MTKSENFLVGCEKQWNQCKNQSDKDILRLAILRKLSLFIHKEKSNEYRSKDSVLLKKIENKLINMQNIDLNSVSISQLLINKSVKKMRNSELPDKIFLTVDKEKINRIDRVWEKTLLTEAIQSNWSLWSLVVWILLSEAENFHNDLSKKMWPTGITLFVESLSSTKKKGTAMIWQGKWFLIIKNDFDPQHYQIQNLTGFSSQPIWTLC